VTPNITGDKGNYDTRDTITEPGQHTHVNYLDYQVCIYAKDLKNSVSKRIPFLSSQRIMEQLNTVRTSFIVNERAKRATNERLNWATWENK
jgi:hypothetical protein